MFSVDTTKANPNEVYCEQQQKLLSIWINRFFQKKPAKFIDICNILLQTGVEFIKSKCAVMRKKEIVFDSLKRKNFLTGFQKRKNERRARAKEQLERDIKEERKRIRNDIKNSMANMKKTFQPLVLDPEIEEKVLEKEYEDDEVEINVIELAPGNKNLDEESDNDSNSSESSDKDSHINSIPGMEFNVESVEKEKRKKPKQIDNSLSELGKIGNKKTLDRLKKKKALKEFKKSKIFKQKERADKKKQHKTRRGLKHSKSKPKENGTFGNKNKHNRFKRGHSSGRGKRR